MIETLARLIWASLLNHHFNMNELFAWAYAAPNTYSCHADIPKEIVFAIKKIQGRATHHRGIFDFFTRGPRWNSLLQVICMNRTWHAHVVKIFWGRSSWPLSWYGSSFARRSSFARWCTTLVVFYHCLSTIKHQHEERQSTLHSHPTYSDPLRQGSTLRPTTFGAPEHTFRARSEYSVVLWSCYKFWGTKRLFL